MENFEINTENNSELQNEYRNLKEKEIRNKAWTAQSGLEIPHDRAGELFDKQLALGKKLKNLTEKIGKENAEKIDKEIEEQFNSKL